MPTSSLGIFSQKCVTSGSHYDATIQLERRMFLFSHNFFVLLAHPILNIREGGRLIDGKAH